MAVRNKPMGRIPVGVIDDLWHGSIDMHIHPGPDPNAERPVDSLMVAQQAQEAGMGGVVLKSFFYPTAAEAFVIQKHVAPAVRVFGSVVISETATGGLQYAAKTIETNAKIGCKVVWFPAMDALWCRQYLKQEGGITILQENGELKPEVAGILEVIKKYNLVVCSGHMSFPETKALFTAASGMGITKMVATHPLAESEPLHPG